jgi:hypothetical protein
MLFTVFVVKLKNENKLKMQRDKQVLSLCTRYIESVTDQSKQSHV